jgi:ABC-2 type transport system permease protein
VQANPVIIKELRGRMRGWRAAVILTVYLLVLSGITLLFYGMLRPTTSYGSITASQLGKVLFGALVVFQTIMVGLLTPAFTAGSITAEKEQKTYDLLVTTLLPARSIIFGKLGSALAYVLLLILAIAPMESLSFMFGGVSPEEIILSQVVMLAAALLFASVGIFWSTLLRSSVASNVLTYGTILFQMIGVPVLYYTITSIMGAYTYNPNATSFTQTEPYFYTTGVVLSFNPLIAMILSETLLMNGDPLFVYTSTTILNGKTLLVVSPWLIFCVEALLLSAVLVLLSIRQVQPIRMRNAEFGMRNDGAETHASVAPVAHSQPANPLPEPPAPAQAQRPPDNLQGPAR